MRFMFPPLQPFRPGLQRPVHPPCGYADETLLWPTARVNAGNAIDIKEIASRRACARRNDRRCIGM
jgi:hypothetical protein